MTKVIIVNTNSTIEIPFDDFDKAVRYALRTKESFKYNNITDGTVTVISEEA